MKRSFQYKEDIHEYTIKVKRRRFNWLYLLLLLPLLLLIKWEEDVVVKTENAYSGKAVGKAEVHMVYSEAFLYDKGRFFTNDTIHKIVYTDQAKGTAKIHKVRYSIYSWVFKYFTKANFTASDSCYLSDTVRHRYHGLTFIDTVKIKLKPAPTRTVFLAVDKDDQQPLPGTKIYIESELAGYKRIDTATAGTDGKVIIDSLPHCGRIIRATATYTGYYPDSIINEDISSIAQKNNSSPAKFELIPIRKPIVFYVEDCETKVGIADADAIVEFNDPVKQSQTRISVKTNINGVGKGVYDSAKILSDVHISATKSYYERGELPGWHSVEKFADTTQYSREKRTFCLQPLPNPLTFINTDQLSGKRLSGVENLVTIENGERRIDTTLISNSRGEFMISTKPGDQISVHASDPPCYEDNNYTINRKDGMTLLNGPSSGRNIPLKPVLRDMTFRVYDQATGNLLPGSEIMFYEDGQPMNGRVVNHGDGTFTVKSGICSNISISASKIGYITNNQKINNEPADLLSKSPQAERDIPLQRDQLFSSENPCLIQQRPSNGDNYRVFSLDPAYQGFEIDYDFADIQDRMIVYCGNGTSGKVLADFTGQNKGVHPYIDRQGCTSPYITVQIIASPNERFKQDISQWTYTFICK